jgi:hypothetical protein
VLLKHIPSHPHSSAILSYDIACPNPRTALCRSSSPSPSQSFGHQLTRPFGVSSPDARFKCPDAVRSHCNFSTSAEFNKIHQNYTINLHMNYSLPMSYPSAASPYVSARLNPRTTLVCRTSITEPKTRISAEVIDQHFEHLTHDAPLAPEYIR